MRFVDELTSDFVTETRDMLEHVTEALIAWEGDPTDLSRLDQIFRFVHTVKGSCGFLGLPRIEAIAHAAETALSGVRDKSRVPDEDMVAALIAIIDRIALLVGALESGETDLPEQASDALLVASLDRRIAAVDGFEAAAVRQQRSVRIAVPLLEGMMNQVSELVLVRNEMARGIGSFDNVELTAAFERLGGIVGELRDSVTRARMQPIERLFATLPRLVRDTARECGKDVKLELSGQGVEIDREMVESIRDPLIHIVRNAIDHGVEAREQRIAAGKPTTSVLRISAVQSGNQVSIEISDDGRGIDIAKLVRRALAANILDSARAEALDAAQSAMLVFEPGISTADRVTTMSGRGVGMDVVRANVERLGGRVALANRPGQGLTVTLQAPLTLSIVNALLVAAGGQVFGLPQGAIEEVLSIRQLGVRIEPIGGGLVAVVRGMVFPAYSLSALLGGEMGTPAFLVMLTLSSGSRFALAVDAVLDHEELVVRPMSPQIAAIGLFAGQSLGHEGRPIIVLDPAGLAASAGVVRSAAHELPVQPKAIVRGPSIVIATALDGQRICVRTAIVERLIDTDRRDWTEIDGQRFVLIAGQHVEAIGEGTLPDAGYVPALLLRSETERRLLPVAAVHDLGELGEVTPVARLGVEGLARIGDESLLLLDLAARPTTSASRRKAIA